MVTATTTALVLEAPRQLVSREFPLPAIGDDDALLRVEACGLCGTDHEQFTGALYAPYPFVPGHETVGVIERIGDGAAARWGVDIGDRVAVEVFMACGTCERCRAGDERWCVKHGLAGMYGAMSTERAPSLWGGYAQHQYLAPDTRMHRVPDGLDPAVATLFNPLGAGVRWGVTVPGTTTGSAVAILGPGIRGLSAVVAVKRAGARFVMVTGAGERDAERLALAEHFGADVAVDVTTTDPVAAFREHSGGLADIVVDVTAKAPAALGQAIKLARPGGTIVMAGTRGSDDTPGFAPDHIVYKELRIIGALGVDGVAYREALRILAENTASFASLPRRTACITEADDVAALLETMAGERDTPPIHAALVP